MWTCVKSQWGAADSMSDLRARLAPLRAESPLPLIEGDDANTCGLLTVLTEPRLLVPVCYSHVGIRPSAAVSDGLVAIGMGDQVVAVHRDTGAQVFRYKMPTAFHEFVPWAGLELLCRDEIGFVMLSAAGKETWSFLLDVIGRFEVKGCTIEGETLEGEAFQIQLPSTGCDVT